MTARNSAEAPARRTGFLPAFFAPRFPSLQEALRDVPGDDRR